MKELKKVNWLKLHTKNYGGSCQDCGGCCTDESSINEWEKVYYNIDVCAKNECVDPEWSKWSKKRKYYQDKMSEYLTYVFVK